MNRQSLFVLFTMASLAGPVALSAQEPTESQGAILRPTPENSSLRGRRLNLGNSTSSGGWEVFQNFVIDGKKCIQLNSSLDFTGADTVAIAWVALNTDIRQTQVYPFFGVQNAPYMVASNNVLQGSSFYPFTDAGSGTVPVMGNQLSLRVCNGSAYQIRYTQLTLYVSHKYD